MTTPVDRYGDVEFPARAPVRNEAAGDRSRTIIVDFAAAVLNASVQAPWSAVCPEKKVVETKYAWNPEKWMFSDGHLPSLFCWRDGGDKLQATGDEWKMRQDHCHLRWVFPLTKQTIAKLREPIIGALSSALDRAFSNTRHPAYVHPDDPDIWAPTYQVQPVAILKPKATSTLAAVYSGAGLDGALAGQAVPRRGVVLDLGGAPSSWITGSHITVTGLDVMGVAVTLIFSVDATKVPYRLFSTSALSRVDSIVRDAQAGAAGTLAVGLGARRGWGTSVVDMGRCDVDMLTTAAFDPVVIHVEGTKQSKVYPAIGWTFTLRERLVRAPEQYPTIGDGIDETGAAAVVPGAQNEINPVDGITVKAAYP